MIETAENLRRDYGISREEQDELAVRSHQRAVAAHEAGHVRRRTRPGHRSRQARQARRRRRPRRAPARRHHRRGASARCARSALKLDPESTVTAGNASGQNDGAAMCVVTTRDEAERARSDARCWRCARGRSPACGPEVMGIGPVRATAAALDRAGLTLDEIDLIELNEAFAAQVLAVLREWKLDPTRRAPQPQRLRHLARPPGRRHRRPHPGHAAARAAAPRRALRPGDDVHRRRPGPRRGLRGRPMSAVQVDPVITGREDGPVVVPSNSLGPHTRCETPRSARLRSASGSFATTPAATAAPPSWPAPTA